MNALTVRFCVGCGYVLDEMQHGDGRAGWIAAHLYRQKYGFGLDKLVLIEDACPPCTRVFAIARSGALPRIPEEGVSEVSSKHARRTPPPV